jgi:phosphatidylglycerophosphatase C
VLAYDIQRLLRLEPERRDVEGEDPVEALIAKIRVLERHRLEHGPAGLDVQTVPAPGGGDHLMRAVDGSDPTRGTEPLRYQRDRYSVPAADLENTVAAIELQRLDRPDEPLRYFRRHARMNSTRPAMLLPSRFRIHQLTAATQIRFDNPKAKCHEVRPTGLLERASHPGEIDQRMMDGMTESEQTQVRTPAATTASDGEFIAIFDFDKTLVSIDTGSAFIWAILRRSMRRTVAAALAMPIVGPLFLARRTRLTGVSIILWIATVGDSGDDFDRLCAEFGSTFHTENPGGRTFGSVLGELREHVRAGHRAVVISGSFRPLVELIIKRLVDGRVEVIGSSVRAFGRGLIAHHHCVGETKVKMALHHGLPDRQWDVGYSDSAADIHVLRRCKRRILINPSEKTIAAYRRAFGGEFEIVRCN